MYTHEFVDSTAPEALYAALAPIAPPAGTGACARHDPARFATPQRQQATFDGDPGDPATDYPAARAICLGCPLLDECRRYADDSRDEYTFLGGMSAEQRSSNKQNEIARRRLQVRGLHSLGAPTHVIAELVRRDPSLIRSDLRTIGQQAAPAS